MSFGAWVALSVAAGRRACVASSASAPPVSRYDFDAGEDVGEGEVPDSGRARRNLSAERGARVLRAGRGTKELVVIDGADHLFDGKAIEVGEAIEDSARDWSG